MTDSSNIPIGTISQKVGEHPYFATVAPHLIRNSYNYFSMMGQYANFTANLMYDQAEVLRQSLTNPKLTDEQRQKVEQEFVDTMNSGYYRSMLTLNYDTATKFYKAILEIKKNKPDQDVLEEQKRIQEEEVMFETALKNELQKMKLSNKVMEETIIDDEKIIEQQAIKPSYQDLYDAKGIWQKWSEKESEKSRQQTEQLSKIIDLSIQHKMPIQSAFRTYEKMRKLGQLTGSTDKLIYSALLSSKVKDIERRFKLISEDGSFGEIRAIEAELKDVDLGFWDFARRPEIYRKKKELELAIKTKLASERL